MIFLFFFKKKQNTHKKIAFFSFYQHSAAVPYCMIKEHSTCNSIYRETLCERYWYKLTLDCTWMFFFFCFWDKRCQPWPYRNTTPLHCYCMKEELGCKWFLVRQTVQTLEFSAGGSVKALFFSIHFKNEQIVHVRMRGGDAPLVLTRWSWQCIVLLPRLFHNTTRYCEAALGERGRKARSALPLVSWFVPETNFGTSSRANSCFMCSRWNETLRTEERRRNQGERCWVSVPAVMCLNIHRCALTGKRPVCASVASPQCNNNLLIR